MAAAPNRLSVFNVTALALGLAFLYLPIVILIIYSFNASRLVTVWGGWSLRWYHEFFNDSAMIEAAWMSLRIAALSATAATLLGSANQLMIGRVLSDEFFANRDWPVASAVAIVMLVLLLVPILIFQRYNQRELERSV